MALLKDVFGYKPNKRNLKIFFKHEAIAALWWEDKEGHTFLTNPACENVITGKGKYTTSYEVERFRVERIIK